jgi:hypothetical protein
VHSFLEDSAFPFHRKDCGLVSVNIATLTGDASKASGCANYTAANRLSRGSLKADSVAWKPGYFTVRKQLLSAISAVLPMPVWQCLR